MVSYVNPQTRMEDWEGFDPRSNAPSPADIQRLTAKIRRTWTSRERNRRAGLAGRYVEMIQMPLQPHRKGFSGDL